MGKIATKAFCNTLKSGSFTGDLTQCPTRRDIETAGFQVSGSYSQDQLVQEVDIANLTWEYTFEVSPRSASIPGTGGSQKFTVTSYKVQYSTSSSGEHEEVDRQEVSYSSTKSGQGTWTSSTNTLSMDENNSSSQRNGTITFTQAESNEQIQVTYSQSAGSISYGPVNVTVGSSYIVAIAGSSVISGSGINSTGGKTNVNVSYSQTYGYNGSTTGGGTITTGGTVTWGSTSISSLGTRETSGETNTGQTVRATVQLNGKTGYVDIPIYQERNTKNYDRTDWGEWEWRVSVSANPSSLGSSGGSVTISSSASGEREGTIYYDYTSGSESSEPTRDTDTGTPTLALQESYSGVSLQGNTVTVGSSETNRTITVKATYEGISNTCTIQQAGVAYEYRYFITVNPESDTHPAVGDYTDISVDSYVETWKSENGGAWQYVSRADCDWTASGSSTGFSLSGTSGNGSGTCRVTSSENTSEASTRSITITFTNTDDPKNETTGRCTITQSARTSSTEYYFSVTPSQRTFNPTGGSSTLKVVSYSITTINGSPGSPVAVGWTCSGSSDTSFFTFPGSGNGSTNTSGTDINVSANKNTSETDKVCHLKFSQSSSGKTANVDLTLSKNVWTYTLTLSKSSIEFPLEPSSPNQFEDSVTVTSYRTGSNGDKEDVSWSASKSNADWLNIAGSSGSNGDSFKLTTELNTGTSDNSGVITVTQSGGLSKEISVVNRKEDFIYTVMVTPDVNFSAPGEGGDINTSGAIITAVKSGSFVPEENIGWTVSSSDSWITITSPSSGQGNGDGSTKFSATATANTTGSSRTGTIIFKTVEGDGVKEVKVVQESVQYSYSFYTTPSSASEISASGGSQKFTVTSYKQYDGGSEESVGWSFKEFSPSVSWARVSGSSSGTNKGTITVSIDENETTLSRSTDIVLVQDESGDEINVPLSQESTPLMFKVANNIDQTGLQYVYLRVDSDINDEVYPGEESKWCPYDFFYITVGQYTSGEKTVNGEIDLTFDRTLTNVTVGVAGSTGVTVSNEGELQSSLTSMTIYLNRISDADAGETSIEFSPGNNSNFNYFSIKAVFVFNRN